MRVEYSWRSILMKIVVAPDSFKGSLSAIEVAKTVEKAIKKVTPTAQVIMKPMADGGEGTLDCLLHTTNSRKVYVECKGPLGNNISSYYGITSEKLAIIEIANIAGLMQVPRNKRNPIRTTTYGLGEVIKDALNRGCRSFTIGLGGSATNDGGLGMLIALGMKAYDKHGNELKGFGKDLLQLARVDVSTLDERLKDANIQVASDVDNPLCGKRGATATYGPQKGLRRTEIETFDIAMEKYSSLIESALQKEYRHIPGSGAAGGLGFALLCLNANIISGAKLVSTMIELEKEIAHAQLVITGEGQSDEQTLFGKAPSYVAKLANKHGVPAVLLSAAIKGDRDKLLQLFSGCFSITNKPMTIQESIGNVKTLLFEQTKNIMTLIKTIRKGV